MTLSKDDWATLTPDRFELLCADLLVALGFENVTRVAGSGDRGRDVLCDRTFRYDDVLTDRFSWIVQCKHYGDLGKADIIEDLAKVATARVDAWWLMTSATVSPGFRDWLTGLAPSPTYPFRIRCLDRPILAALLDRHPLTFVKYFPDLAAAEIALEAGAMDLMNKGEYAEAARFLESRAPTPRTSYLLACSYASQGDTARAFDLLKEAFDSGYLEFMRARQGLPAGAVRERTWTDGELQSLKTHDEARFRRIIGYPVPAGGSSGGCFPAGITVSTPQGKRDIAAIRTGDLVEAAVLKDARHTGEISAVHVKQATSLVMINDTLLTTADQPVAVPTGWRAAGALAAGDLIATENGPELVASAASLRTAPMPVYALTVTGPASYYANGYFVHNKMPDFPPPSP